MLPLVFIYLLAPAVRSEDILQFDAGAAGTLPVQCEEFNLTWAGGTPPFRLDITTFQSRTWTETHDRISDRFYLWQVDFGAGSLLLIQLTDGEGQDTLSRSLPQVQPSEDDSCVFQPPGAPSPSTSTSTSSKTSTTSTTTHSTKTASPTSSVTASTTSQSTVTTESSSLSTSPSPSPSSSSRSLTLSAPSTSSTSSSVSLSPSSSAGGNTGATRASLHIGAIAGIAVGAALVLTIAPLLCYFARRRRRQRLRSHPLEDDSSELVTDAPKLSPFTKGAPMMSHVFSVLDISSGGDGSYGNSSAVEGPSELSLTAEDGTLTVSRHAQPPSSEIDQSAGADAVPREGSDSRPPVKADTTAAQPLARPREPLIQRVTASSTGQAVRTPRRTSRSSNILARMQRSHRTEVDGGVRLAGGPADELYEDDPDEDARTLPPPYQRF